MADDAARKQPPRRISRANFIELCLALTAEDEKAFKALWQRLGLSVDWRLEYSTINERSRRIAQSSFLDLHRKGQVYQVEAPTLWDVDFKTAVAQAEVEDRPQKGAFHHVRFGVEGGGELRRRHDAPRAASGLRGGGRAPRRRALPAALREAGGDARLPRAGAHLPERARGPREGHGHPDGLHVRRRDRRAVVARAGPRPAPGDRPRRAPGPRGVRGRALPEPRPREGERGVRAPGRPDRQGGAEGRRGAAARPVRRAPRARGSPRSSRSRSRSSTR